MHSAVVMVFAEGKRVAIFGRATPTVSRSHRSMLGSKSRVGRSGQPIKTQLILPLTLSKSCPFRHQSTVHIIFIGHLENIYCLVILIYRSKKYECSQDCQRSALIGQHDWLPQVFPKAVVSS